MIQDLNYLLERYPQLNNVAIEIQQAYDVLKSCYLDMGVVYICGNGGSASDSEHIVGELMKSFRLPRPLPKEEKEKLKQMGEIGQTLADNLQQGLPAVSLVSSIALNTAILNDIGAVYTYAQQVYAYGKPGDVLIAISTSGNSANILYAATAAKAKGMKVLGLSGKSGGKLKELCDVCIMAPSNITEEIQEYHLPIYHALCRSLEEYFWGAKES